jgi:hypothetical protein
MTWWFWPLVAFGVSASIGASVQTVRIVPAIRTWYGAELERRRRRRMRTRRRRYAEDKIVSLAPYRARAHPETVWRRQ